MYLKYGNYRHADNEASVSISKNAIFTPGGLMRGTRERWSISGRLQAANQVSLTAAINALCAAYELQNQDVAFYTDGNQLTSHAIDSSATNGGVRVTGPPSFPEGKGAEYSTFRNYTISLEAEWLNPNATIVNWHETISVQGGGPQFVFLETIDGPPHKQLLKQYTTYQATQSGEATGFYSYPTAPAPLWPAAEHVDRRQMRYELPKRAGPPGEPTYTEFKVSWTYTFEDGSPLVGVPTPWPI
jgi:hypothetical protein